MKSFRDVHVCEGFPMEIDGCSRMVPPLEAAVPPPPVGTRVGTQGEPVFFCVRQPELLPAAPLRSGCTEAPTAGLWRGAGGPSLAPDYLATFAARLQG